MAYTKHGQIITAGKETNEERPKLVRCGGPTICKECALEVLEYQFETQTKSDLYTINAYELAHMIVMHQTGSANSMPIQEDIDFALDLIDIIEKRNDGEKTAS